MDNNPEIKCPGCGGMHYESDVPTCVGTHLCEHCGNIWCVESDEENANAEG